MVHRVNVLLLSFALLPIRTPVDGGVIVAITNLQNAARILSSCAPYDHGSPGARIPGVLYGILGIRTEHTRPAQTPSDMHPINQPITCCFCHPICYLCCRHVRMYNMYVVYIICVIAFLYCCVTVGCTKTCNNFDHS